MHVYLGIINLKRTWDNEVRNVSTLVAIGVGQDGYRNILSVAEGCTIHEGLFDLKHQTDLHEPRRSWLTAIVTDQPEAFAPFANTFRELGFDGFV